MRLCLRQPLRNFFILALFATGGVAPAPCPAAPGLDQRPAYVEAVTALRENRPGEAAEKLTQLIETAEDLESAAVSEVRQLQLEALVRNGEIGPAIDIGARPEIRGQAAAAFWHSIALARAGQYHAAVQRLDEASKKCRVGDAFYYELWWNLALCRHRAGDRENALAALGPLMSDEAPPRHREKAIQLAARIEIDRNQINAAEAWLSRPVLPPGNLAALTERELLAVRIHIHPMREEFDQAESKLDQIQREATGTPVADRAVLLRSEVSLAADRPGEASTLLFDLIEESPGSPSLETAFRRLKLLHSNSPGPLLRQCARWSADESEPSRQSLALFFLAAISRASGDFETAITHFARFLNQFPDHPLFEEAALHEAETLIAAQRLDEAESAARILQSTALLPATRDRLPHLQAHLKTAKERVTEAIALYRQAMNQAESPSSRATAAFNGALASVLIHDESTYDELRSTLPSGESQAIAGELLLERGLYEAAQAEPTAFEHLEDFVHQYPGHPRAPDAEIALAELYLNQVPPQSIPAREHLDAASLLALSLQQKERLDYVGIWVEMAAMDSTAAIERARRFLDDWPRSSRRPHIYMVLGESEYRNGSFAAAAEQFEALAIETPDSSFADAALFFAGKAVSQLIDQESHERAFALWERLAEKGGPFAPPARHEQGLLRLSQERFDEAAIAFDSAAAMPEADPQLVIAALADKGEALYARAALDKSTTSSAEALAAAADALEAVAGNRNATRSWRLQATVRRGKCLEGLNKPDEALALYLDVVENGAPAGPVAASPTVEFDWFYRAGLAAVRLLQHQEKWEDAVAVAERISQFGGPRAAEAAKMADRLRLRHFIWQNPGVEE